MTESDFSFHRITGCSAENELKRGKGGGRGNSEEATILQVVVVEEGEVFDSRNILKVEPK